MWERRLFPEVCPVKTGRSAEGDGPLLDDAHVSPDAPAQVARGKGTLVFLALVAVTLVGPMSMHLFIPALPQVRQAFGVEASVAQLAFSLSMLSMAAATLFYGSLSDRFGRLPVLVCGIGLFAGGAAVAALAPSIGLLILGRIIQGLGAACGMVLARAIARDLYGTARLGEMIAYLTAAYVVGPMFAPPLGGILTDMFGWQAVLIAPTLFGILAIAIAVTFIGETRPERTGSSPPVIRGALRLFGTPRFMLFALNPAFGTAGFFALNTGSAYLMAEVLRRPATEFGLFFMIGAAGYLLGSFLSGRLSGRVPGNVLVIVGSVVSVLGAALLAGLIGLIGLSPLCLFLPSALLSIGQGLAMPHAQAAAIAAEPELTGTASGIVVFLQFLLAAVLTQAIGLSAHTSATPLIVVVCASSTLALASGTAAVLLTRR
jgi:MFS transporter, DHA1 family, multidrug resistance protein